MDPIVSRVVRHRVAPDQVDVVGERQDRRVATRVVLRLGEPARGGERRGEERVRVRCEMRGVKGKTKRGGRENERCGSP